MSPLSHCWLPQPNTRWKSLSLKMSRVQWWSHLPTYMTQVQLPQTQVTGLNSLQNMHILFPSSTPHIREPLALIPNLFCKMKCKALGFSCNFPTLQHFFHPGCHSCLYTTDGSNNNNYYYLHICTVNKTSHSGVHLLAFEPCDTVHPRMNPSCLCLA